MDTKKKEILGPFRRDNGTAYCTEPVKVNDHDYSTFSNGKMVPHGIYDVMRNTGYIKAAGCRSVLIERNADNGLSVICNLLK